MQSIINVLLALLLILIFNIETCGQVNQEVKNILNTSFSKTQVNFHREKAMQLNKLNYKIPVIEQVEIRSETNDFDLRKQDFAIRVSTNNTSTRKAYKKYHESVKFITDMEYNSEVLLALTERYNLIVEYVYTQEIIIIQEMSYEIAKDKVKLLKRMVSLSTFNIIELIEAEDDVYRIHRDLQDNENEISTLHSILSTLIGVSKLNILKKDVIKISDIKSMLVNISTMQNTHPDEEIVSARHYNAMLEHEWENTKSEFKLGFIQARYGYDQENEFKSNFSLGMGFSFPLEGSSRIDLNERKIKILDTQSTYVSVKEEILQEKSESETRITRLLRMYELLSTQIKEGNAEYALEQYRKKSIASPISLIKLKELNISNQLLLLEIEKEITTSYIQYLYNTGIIGEKPYRNFLDSNLPML